MEQKHILISIFLINITNLPKYRPPSPKIGKIVHGTKNREIARFSSRTISWGP